MSYVLSVYCRNAFKEFLLPAINDADYSIILSRNVFGLDDDMEIPLEVIGHQWSFVETDEYELVCDHNSYFKEPIKDGNIIHLRQRNAPEIAIIVKITDTYFSVYEKYNLNRINAPITIGGRSDCIIQYSFLNLISDMHAQIVRRDGRYYVEDISNKNGIFVNNIRVQGQIQLRFGDCIDIYGLRIIALNEIIAVNTGTSETIRVSDKLPPYMRQPMGASEYHRPGKHEYFHRAPRRIAKIDTEPVEIDGPPNPKELNQGSLLMTVGPALSMALPMVLGCTLAIYSTQKSGASSGVFMFTGLVTAVSSALLGTIWALVNMRNAKKSYEEEESRRNHAHLFLRICGPGNITYEE